MTRTCWDTLNYFPFYQEAVETCEGTTENPMDNMRAKQRGMMGMNVECMEIYK